MRDYSNLNTTILTGHRVWRKCCKCSHGEELWLTRMAFGPVPFSGLRLARGFNSLPGQFHPTPMEVRILLTNGNAGATGRNGRSNGKAYRALGVERADGMR